MTKLDWAKARSQERVGRPRVPASKGSRKRQSGWAAKYASTCILCKEPITVGTQVRSWDYPQLAHLHCIKKVV